MHKILLSGEEDTAALARRIAGHLEPGECVLLSGTLGAGKTTFARHLIRMLAGDETDITSPTFTLVHPYALPESRTLWHVDLYRIRDSSEIDELGLAEALQENITVIEWPERMVGRWPQNYLHVILEIRKDDARMAQVETGGSWIKKYESIRMR